MRKFFLFMDTVTNKVDTKGRVSLPADYRDIVKELSTEIVCYRSFSAPCIEGCTEDLLDKLQQNRAHPFVGAPFAYSSVASSVLGALSALT